MVFSAHWKSDRFDQTMAEQSLARLRQIDQVGGKIWVTETVDWTAASPGGTLKIGISEKAIGLHASRGLRYRVGQMYGVVGPGLIMAQHVFKGLRRGMLVGDDGDAAPKKLSITWAARRDAMFTGHPNFGGLKYLEAPESSIFAVYVSPNKMLKEFPDIYGWAEHWTWIAADPDMPGAPIDWGSRYDSRLWSKEDAQ